MTERYSKPTRTIPAVKVTAPLVATIFFDSWITPCGTPNTDLTDRGPQVVTNFFVALCASLQTILVTTTEYRPQFNKQAEKYSKTLVACLRH